MNDRKARTHRTVALAPVAFALLLAAKLGAAQSSPDIRDIRGPLPIGSPWLIWSVAAALLVVAGGVSYAAWIRHRRRSRGVTRGPLDIALGRLERARLLMSPPQGREFSVEVSGAVRDFIESRYAVRASHLTTDEFLHQLLDSTDARLSGQRPLLDHFLQTCDLAKFGGWNLPPSDMEVMLQSARRFIEESAATGPTPAPAAASPATASPAAASASTSTSRNSYVSFPSA